MAVAKPKEIHKIGDIGYMHMMLIAPSGFGKTVFLGSHPKVLLLLTDPEGSFSAKRMGSDIDEWTCHDADELEKAYFWLRDGGTEHYDIVAIDNISHAQKLMLKKAKKQSLSRNNSKADPLVPEQGDYLRAQLGIDDMVLKFHDLPIHVVWTAWQEEHENINTGDIYYAPNIQGSKGALAQQILGYMNINAFGQVIEKDGKEVRRMYFSQQGPYRGKDRFQVLGKFKDDLTLPKMLTLIESTKASGTKKVATKKTATTAAPRKRRVATTK